ncbi:MAG: phosphoglycerate dehydrogenase [Cellulomonas sp.]|nr:phosphoglycerate dehydrogenase [Cellulomonas sp.]
MPTILLPNSISLHPTLPQQWRTVTYDVADRLPDEAAEAVAMVVWGTSQAVLDEATALPALTWVADLAAGTDRTVAAGFDPRVQITSGVGLHDATVTEHTLALVLACVRRVPDLVRAQSTHRWATELGGLQELHPTDRLRTLLGARVLVWGFGSIGAHLAPVLAALGAHVTGVARSASTRGGFPVVTPEEALGMLGRTDVLIGLLPDTATTRHVLGADVFAALPRRAVVVNVGRGSTLDADALLAAVRRGAVGAAALDVVDPEPLPADSPLWDEPRILISPHAAGGRPAGADDLIADNLARLVEGRPLRNLVRRSTSGRGVGGAGTAGS